MRKKSVIIFTAIILVSFVMIISAVCHNDNTLVNHSGYQTAEVQPDLVMQQQPDEKQYIFSVNQLADKGSCLAFYTTNQFITVYGDGQILYELTQGNPHFGHTPGSLWNFVTIPNNVDEIKVIITGAYAAVYDYDITFYMGDGQTIYRSLLKNSIHDGEMSLIVLLVGNVMILSWFFTRKKTKIRGELLYLGVFSVMMGMWSYGETEMSVLLQANHQASTFAAFVLLMALPIPFILFMKDFFRLESARGWKIFLGIEVVNFVVCSCMELFEIRDFKETIISTHLLILGEMAYMLFCILLRLRRDGWSRFVRVNVIGIAILIGSCVGDLYHYYKGMINTDSVGRVGFFLYIIILGLESASEYLFQIEVGRRAMFYRELAITDGLTGVMNRNGFNQYIEKAEKLKDIAVIAFDLNELKKCNDQWGHAAGDQYIIQAADIIMKAFAPYGKCYRIGGDEFVVIIERQSQCDLMKLIHKMEQREDEFNQNQKIQMVIAWGIAVFDQENDCDLKATLQRADQAMYEKKKKMKAESGE